MQCCLQDQREVRGRLQNTCRCLRAAADEASKYPKLGNVGKEKYDPNPDRPPDSTDRDEISPRNEDDNGIEQQGQASRPTDRDYLT